MRIVDFIFAARPMLHLPIWSVYLVALHYHLDLSGERLAWSDIGMLCCLSLLAAGAYYINQVYDYHSDRINDKLGFLHRGMVTERGLDTAFLTASLVGLIGAAAFSLFILMLFLQLFVLGYVYSAPPLRLKDRPFWGLSANAYGIGLLVPLTIMPDLQLHSAGLLGWDNPICFFLAVGAVYLLTTLPDRQGDRASGKRTLAVVFPPWAVKILAGLFLIMSAVIAYRSRHSLLSAVALASLLPVMASFSARSPQMDLLAAKLPILLLTLLAAWFFPWYLIFVVALIGGTRIYYRRRFGILYPRVA